LLDEPALEFPDFVENLPVVHSPFEPGGHRAPGCAGAFNLDVEIEKVQRKPLAPGFQSKSRPRDFLPGINAG